MTPEEEDGVRLIADAYARWESMPPVALTVDRVQLWTLMMACQTMMTHPGTTPTLSAAWEHTGRQFQEAACDSPELYALAEAGWNPAYHVEPEKSP